MNILIVTAHPSSKGDTHTIAKTYADAKIEKGHTVEIMNLYAPEYANPYFAFENIREYELSPVQKKFHEKMIWANEIVVVHPVFWNSVPAIMKNWIDLTIWPRVAYRYSPEGKVMKLFEGKTAKVFATSGGPSWWFYFPFVLPLRTFWELCVFGFCGVDLIDFQVCGNMDKWKDEKRANHLANFLKRVKKSAQKI